MNRYDTAVMGHEDVWRRIRSAAARGRLSGAYLFAGSSGIGKRTFANSLAQALFCELHAEAELLACGQCQSCRQVAAGTHPDLDVVELPPERAYIPIELLIGEREHRMRSGVCHRLALTPMQARRRIAIIDDADYLRVEGANCLLKTLEEPPPGALLILISTSVQRQLPTIRSRCQLVRFRELSTEDVQRVLLEKQLAANQELARSLAQMSQGSVALASTGMDDQWMQFRKQLISQLGNIQRDVQQTWRLVQEFVDQAGTDAAAKRSRMKQAAQLGADYYRQLLRRLCDSAPSTEEALLCAAINDAADRWQGDRRSAADCVMRCIEAVGQVEANANPATWLAAWTEDLGRLALGAH